MMGRGPLHQSIDATVIKKALRCDSAKLERKYPYITWNISTRQLITAHRSPYAARRSRLKAWRRAGTQLLGLYRYNSHLDAYVYLEV